MENKWKIKLNKDMLFKKSPREIKFLQKFKDFYSNKINSTPKKFSFWILAIISFVFFLPFCLGGVLVSYIFPRIETKPSWLKIGIISLILIMTFQIGMGWSKDLLGMNMPPNIVVSNPITKEMKVKGVNTIEISGNVDPVGSIIQINGGVVAVTGEGYFVKKVSINKGKNEINIIGQHGSGTTEKTIIVHRELTEEEIAEEKIKEEERKARAEEERIAREEAKKKAEAEAQARAEAERQAKEKAEEKRIQELADTFCETRSKQYAKYVHLDDFAEAMKKGGTYHNVYNKPPSKSSCKNIAEQCLRVWSGEDCKNIAERKIWLGMTANQLTLSWKIPQDENDTVGIWGIHTQWVFNDFGPYVYLEGDSRDNLVVVSWQN